MTTPHPISPHYNGNVRVGERTPEWVCYQCKAEIRLLTPPTLTGDSGTWAYRTRRGPLSAGPELPGLATTE